MKATFPDPMAASIKFYKITKCLVWANLLRNFLKRPHFGSGMIWGKRESTWTSR